MFCYKNLNDNLATDSFLSSNRYDLPGNPYDLPGNPYDLPGGSYNLLTY